MLSTGEIMLTITSVLGVWHRRSLDAPPVQLANGKISSPLELKASQLSFYKVDVPQDKLPLELTLTTLTGEAGLFASANKAQPSNTNDADWSLTSRRGGHITISGIPKLVKSGAECQSTDEKFGDAGAFDDVGGCAAKCAATAGCKYFIFGTGSKAGSCYMEKTATRECTEGFEEDNFDFYELGGGVVNVGVIAYSDASLTVGATWGNTATQLSDGVPQSGSLVKGHSALYLARVPGSTADLTVDLTVRVGEADLFVSTGRTPTTTDFMWSASTTGDDRLAIKHTDPHYCTDCDYQILVVAKEAATFTVGATSSAGVIILEDGVPRSEAVNLHQYLHFKIFIAPKPSDVQIIMTRKSGNPDLYVSNVTKPTKATAIWSSEDADGDIVTIKHSDPALAGCLEAEPDASGGMCVLYLTVYGAQASSSFSLVATARRVGAGLHIDRPERLAGPMEFYPSLFGSPLPYKPLTAPIVYANPGPACPPENAKADWQLSNAAEMKGAIALVDRGSNCPYPGRYFANKVLAAQKAGAIAVIVADNTQHSHDLVYMGAASGNQASAVTVPSVFVSCAAP